VIQHVIRYFNDLPHTPKIAIRRKIPISIVVFRYLAPHISRRRENTMIIRPTDRPETKCATLSNKGNVGDQYHRITPPATWRNRGRAIMLFTPNGRVIFNSFSTSSEQGGKLP